MIIACDFDNTLCKDAFPGIGEPNQPIIDRVKKYKEEGHQVILWTCRGGKYLQEAIDWCKDKGIEFDAVNEDVPSIKDSEFGNDKSVKVYADIYLDDKAEKVTIEESRRPIHTLMDVWR